ncbi:partial NADH-quinone oxidoreductase subunit E, partial [Candidatus Brocadiaceae bacterium]
MAHIDLNVIKQSYQQKAALAARRIVVCAGTGCVANGALKVLRALEEEIAAAGIPVSVALKFEAPHKENTHLSGSGCQGFCQMGPLVTIEPEGILYVRVKKEDVAEIVESTLKNGIVVDRLLYQ